MIEISEKHDFCQELEKAGYKQAINYPKQHLFLHGKAVLVKSQKIKSVLNQ